MLDSIVALVGTLAGVAGTAVAVVQLRASRRESGGAEQGPVPFAELAGYSVFAPHARVQGFAPDFINRTEELRALSASLERAVSVISIEGIAGAGKTALTTAVCQRLPKRRELRWIFCAEQEDLNLQALATGLAYDPDLPAAGRVKAVLGRPDPPRTQLIDAIIQYLADHRLVLVLDDYHLVRDAGLRRLVDRLERSKIQSTLVLTTRQDAAVPAEGPLVEHHVISGLEVLNARRFLRAHGVDAPDEVLDEVWRITGRGIPEAMRIFAGLARHSTAVQTLGDLPVYTEDFVAWVRRLFDELTEPQQRLAKLISFVHGPADLELLGELADDVDLRTTLDGLTNRFVVSESGAGFAMHDLFRDFARSVSSPQERTEYGSKIARYYQSRARHLLLGQRVEPSYGTLYLESFPNYLDNQRQHVQLIDDLVERLADRSLAPAAGSTVLVLGSGNGIHDPGLAKHGLTVVNVDIQAEIAALGAAATRRLPGRIGYVVADMTEPLPFAAESMDAVFSIGSSFGYEETDEENAAVFKHAARVLKPGGPFVFEYANGDYWYQVQAQREVTIATLPSGAVRTTHRISDPAVRTSLTSISLRRPDGFVGWFHHFMHYYPVGTIQLMMREAGLVPQAVFGAGEGRVTRGDFDPQTSPGMVVIAVKES